MKEFTKEEDNEMIEAKDLRIGNWVSTSDTLIQRHEIKAEDIVSMTDGSFKKFECEILPILLTEEWLVKFGFKLQIDGSYQKNDFSLFLDKRFKTNLYLQDNEKGSFKWFGYECKVKHVHSLQNLYFALCGGGEELTIKE